VSEVKKESATPGGDVTSLLSRLRDHAGALPEGEREVAMDHVAKLHEEASAKPANTLRMRVWLKGLETFPSLIPIVGEVLDALANVGA
jgi:hypothetical protein